MQETEIISLFFARDERALAKSEAEYGAYCAAIARNILGDAEDVKECVNDTWHAAWRSMPPQRPARLRAWLGTPWPWMSWGTWLTSRLRSKLRPASSRPRSMTFWPNCQRTSGLSSFAGIFTWTRSRISRPPMVLRSPASRRPFIGCGRNWELS